VVQSRHVRNDSKAARVCQDLPDPAVEYLMNQRPRGDRPAHGDEELDSVSGRGIVNTASAGASKIATDIAGHGNIAAAALAGLLLRMGCWAESHAVA
jgi:hypothetical protein